MSNTTRTAGWTWKIWPTVEGLFKKKTLVSLMHANNEVGVMVDLAGQCAVRAHGAYFHSDTVQSMGHYPMDLEQNRMWIS